MFHKSTFFHNTYCLFGGKILVKPLGFSEDTDLYRRGASFLALAPVLPALPAHAEEVGVPITEIASGSLVN